MTYPPPAGYPPPDPYPGPGGTPQYWQESPKTKGMAIAALVFAILAVLSFCTVFGGIFFGLIAVVLGVIATVKARRGTAGGGVMAVIALILGAGAMIAAAVFGVLFWGIWQDSGGQDFLDCTTRAGGDQAAIARCEDQFNQRLEDQFGVTMVPPEPTN
ncbi:DUF4190 domain-containing protein [Nocardia sp. NPDC051750]|jgi:hypothetical protein|uniref:DUF4190 domain-containing protein n=1 Tax=Nocardia sp. NPDC051750 TaxID=3364325 RepID=UPI00378FE4A3